jgi:Tol biopolymer transport system component
MRDTKLVERYAMNHTVRAAAWSLALGLLVGGLAGWELGGREGTREARYRPLTFDAGVTTTPAISPDGTLVAYASDRDGGRNLDLYVQQLRGGDPARLTWSEENERDPSFSSDGGALVYHSSKDGGGIYLIPSLGGTPRLLAAGGRNPRFSPQGNLVAYWTGQRDGLVDGQAKTYVVSIAGGEPREIRPDFSAVQRPVWSPDGRRLIVWGVAPGEGLPGDRADFWVTGLERDRAESTGLVRPVTRAGGRLAAIEDMSWTEQGLVFSMRVGWVRSVYRCRMRADGKARGDLQRLAGGTATAEFPAVSRDGQLVFASGQERYDVWGVPLDANRGKALGPRYRISDSTAPAEYPTVSPDGGKVLYASPRNGTSQVWMKDLAKGEESVIAPGPNASAPAWVNGGRQVAFVQKLGKRSDEYLLDLATGQTRKVYEGGFFWDVNAAGTVALAQARDSQQSDIVAVDLKTGRSGAILRAVPGAPLGEAKFSPDAEWIVFLAETGPGKAQIHAARDNGMSEIPRSEWMPVADGVGKVDKPRFSPDGKLIYFMQDSEENRGIRAIRFDARTGETLGGSFKVFDAGEPGLTLWGVSPGSQGLGIGKDKMVMLLRESRCNLWTTAME